MEVELRPMRWRDLDAVLALENELFAGYPPWTPEQFWSELAGVPEARWYAVAVADDRVVGYAGLLLPALAGEPAEIYTIAVDARRQRGGVGTLLMTAMLDEAGRRRVPELLLEVRADNDPALAFYARHGFEQVRLRRRYYQGGRDGLVLRRRVGTRGTS